MPPTPSDKNSLFSAPNARKNETYETIKTILIALVFAMVFRSFLFEPFHIPSGSMKSNLLIGDYLFVSKYSYGYSRYSLPFGLPLFSGRVMELAKPQRGDVIVFRPANKPNEDFIKRLIGMPGDRIQVKEGLVYINDKPVTKTYVDDWVDTDYSLPETLKRYTETLPEGKSFETLYAPNHTIKDPAFYTLDVENTGVYVVPEGHYFMMGDNRDHSADSRYQCKEGVSPEDRVRQCPVSFVPEENIVGKAQLILFSWKGGLSFRMDRFFKAID